jgi:hypothetical protein
MISIDKLESILKEEIIFLTYGGMFTQPLIAGMTSVLEKEVEDADLSMKRSNNIFVVFIELAQNIMNYSKKMKNDHSLDSKGLIFVGKNDSDDYFVCSQNIITYSDRDMMRERLETIKSSSEDEIKSLYRETRRASRVRDDNGAGLGFLEIARKVKNIEFEFNEISEDKLYFKFCATL